MQFPDLRTVYLKKKQSKLKIWNKHETCCTFLMYNLYTSFQTDQPSVANVSFMQLIFRCFEPINHVLHRFEKYIRSHFIWSLVLGNHWNHLFQKTHVHITINTLIQILTNVCVLWSLIEILASREEVFKSNAKYFQLIAY